uniref:Uncharacterized protein n=1 Tax=Vitis vinifera TaxID=29760 RepID=A5BTB1_VITVI|nr:hypothetical protein VITISV_036812 [Vitis vinifera]
MESLKIDFMEFGSRNVSDTLIRFGNIPSSLSCIEYEWQFRRFGRQYYLSLLFDCGQKWIRCSPSTRYQSIRTYLTGEVESPFSLIRQSEKVERLPDPDMRYPDEVECRPDRMATVRHPDKIEHQPDRILIRVE